MAAMQLDQAVDAQLSKAPVDDIEIAYRRVGHGSPVVVLPGGPGIGHAYMRSLDAWAGEVELVYYDQRGSGHTEVGRPEKMSFTGAMSDLDALRRHLGIERLNLVGHSSGAILGLIFAAHHPHKVGSLVLLNPAPPFVPELAQQLQANMAARRTPEDDARKEALKASEGFKRRDPETLERLTLNTYTPFFSDRSWRDRAELGFTSITAANIAAAGQRMFRDLAAFDPLGSLARVECPTLVVHSENDTVPEEFSRLLADRIDSAEYQLISGASHFVLLEDPVILAAVVMPFLRSFVR